MTTLTEFLKTWWLPVATYLLATTPSAIVLFFQNTLSPHIKELQPVVLLNTVALLLWLLLLLLAYILLQRPWLRWDEPTGTWVSRITSLRYCGSCRAKRIIVPLKNEITGWRCVACNTFRTDPARKRGDETTARQSNGNRLGKPEWRDGL